MKALLLAAGHGTRLRPTTGHTPKCLVPINRRPLLDYWLHLLLDRGDCEVLINTHYLREQVEQHVRAHRWAANITLVHEPELLGTGGTLLHNREFFGNEPVLVAHADNLALFDLDAFWQAHLDRAADVAMTMMTFTTDDPCNCGIVKLNKKGLVETFHEKVHNPPGNLANAAIYIFSPEVTAFIASLGRARVDVSTEVLPAFLGRIAIHTGCLYLRDIGTPENLDKAEHDMRLLQHLLAPQG